MTLRIYLGHGASGTAESMAPHVAGLRKRGFQAFALDLPKRKAEDAVPAFEALVPDEPGVVVGGHSYGGRVASLSAAGGRRRYAALVCLSYPLHPPGAVDRADPRRAHWPDIACPALFLSGEADPFARIDLLRAAMPALPNGRLITWPKVGHGLGPVLDEALDDVATFLRGLDTA